MPRSFLTRSVYVAETDEQALEEAAPYLVQQYTWGNDRLERAHVRLSKALNDAVKRQLIHHQPLPERDCAQV